MSHAILPSSVKGGKEDTVKPEVEWLTFSGTIIPNADVEGVPPLDDVLKYVRDNNCKASFMSKDIFACDGDSFHTTVAINRLKPIWYFLAVDYDTFRKEIFK